LSTQLSVEVHDVLVEATAGHAGSAELDHELIRILAGSQ